MPNLRQMEISTDADKLNVDIQATCMKYDTIKKWLYILHDKDDTRPHYHIYLHFGGASVDTKKVAEWFKLGYVDSDGKEHTGENFIEKIKGRWVNALLYSIHGNDSQKNKYQYDPKEVHANFDFEMVIKNDKIIGDFENHSYAEMIEYVDSLPVSEKKTVYSEVKKLWELYQARIIATHSDRQIEVVFITGTSGAGKTTYAKMLFKKLKYDYCVSSSSNDPFQDYMGQAAMLLDDLRDTVFEFTDLLKILDNNTRSSVKGRFMNKVFIGKMIVITSAVPLVYWYKELQLSKIDTLRQLYRRISCYVVVTKDEVTVYDKLDDFGRPAGMGQIFANDLAKYIKMDEPKTDFKSIFGEMCGTSSVGEEVFATEQLKIADSEKNKKGR